MTDQSELPQPSVVDHRITIFEHHKTAGEAKPVTCIYIDGFMFMRGRAPATAALRIIGNVFPGTHVDVRPAIEEYTMGDQT